MENDLEMLSGFIAEALTAMQAACADFDMIKRAAEKRDVVMTEIIVKAECARDQIAKTYEQICDQMYPKKEA